MRIHLPYIIFLSCFWPTLLAAQSGCPDCQVTLPDMLAADTLYLAPAPDGRVGVEYGADISFRIPRTTTPVAATDPTVPPGITIDKITINTLTNMPPGLDWAVNQRVFDLPDETDGCIHICGTPLQAGVYDVEVVITARVFIVDQTTSFTFPLVIEPARSVTDGFTLFNNIGCGEVEVQVENNVPSNGRDGFSYRWDFGNGNTSDAEQPASQRYAEPGVYPVSYQAVVDTSGYILTNVRVDRVACFDIFENAPDLFMRVFDQDGTELYHSPIRKNSRPPVDFNLNLPVGSGNYRLEVLDDDDGIFGGDKICGSFNFTQTTQGALTSQEADVTLTVFHPVDTIRSADSVVVYVQPDPPLISTLTAPPVCAGDTVRLTSSYETGLQWYRDSLPAENGTGPVLAVMTAGQYWLSYTSPDGCRAVSDPMEVTFAPHPSVPVLFVENNLIYLDGGASLPPYFRLDWLLDGVLLETSGTEASLCAQQSGTYTVVLTDLATGCSNRRSLAVTYDPAFPGCTSSFEEFDRRISGVRLFPNPAAGLLTVELEAIQDQDLTWTLFNALGQRIKGEQTRITFGTHQWQIDLEPMPRGVYILQIMAGPARRGYRVVRR